MTSYEDLLKKEKYTWLVTGCAGFIGSNLVEELLKLNQKVVGLDNFVTGKKRNLKHLQKDLSPEQIRRFIFHEGDIRDFKFCKKITRNIDFTLHQAALGSVPRSLKSPLETNLANVTGHLNILYASHLNKVKRFIYASSSSVYGNCKSLPQREEKIGDPLSPYATTKRINELYSQVFLKCYGVETIGLRYFNVFGKRQDPNGAYAAVIPRWIKAFLNKESPIIYGDGSTSRDFCYVKNVVQINILAALTSNKKAIGETFNCAVSKSTSLLNLYNVLRTEIDKYFPRTKLIKPTFMDFRKGDILHSKASVDKAKKLLKFYPEYDLESGLQETLFWYFYSLAPKKYSATLKHLPTATL